MHKQPKSADQPPSLARRHFMGIAAITARRLAAISLTSAALTGFNIREAAAERGHDREGRSEYGGGRWDRDGRGDREGRSEFGGRHDGRNGGGGVGGSQGREGRHGGGNASGGGRSGGGGGGGGVSGAGSSSGGGSSSGSGSASGGKNPSGNGSSSGSDYGSGGGGSSSGGGYTSGSGSGGLRCFGRGTRIQTADGEVAVEDLRVGTPVKTTNGIMPVKWIGRQILNRDGPASWNPDVLPVRIARFAIDDQTPQRDVWLSQEHALFIDGALIPVKYLINGRSIAFDDAARRSETIEYFHVELDTHEVIFAEGMPAETFRYRDGEIAWDNLGEYRERHGDHKMMPPFAPIHSYPGIRAELVGLARLAASRIVDLRDPIHIAYDRLVERAFSKAA